MQEYFRDHKENKLVQKVSLFIISPTRVKVASVYDKQGETGCNRTITDANNYQ